MRMPVLLLYARPATHPGSGLVSYNGLDGPFLPLRIAALYRCWFLKKIARFRIE